MKQSEIVVGGKYTDGKTVRTVVKIQHDWNDLQYRNQKGRLCLMYLSNFALWAKEVVK